MLREQFVRLARNRAISSGKGARLWRRLEHPSLYDWSEYLRRHGGFQAFGEHCAINASAVFTNPYLTRIGTNVRIAGAFLTGHDGSVNMINRAYGTTLDSVGPIIIEDNVFIGEGVIVLPGVTIGERSVVGAGAVVAKDIPPNSVAVGTPAKRVRSLDEHVERMRERNQNFPWRSMIEQRQGGFDAAMEPELRKQRVSYFFGE